MLLYDNLEDVKVKLYGTYCYYKGKAVIIKDAMMDEKGDYILFCMGLSARSKEFINLKDPDFNYMRFNLGYSNHQHSAVWWYRNPVKQFHQGLKNNQVGRFASNVSYMHNCDFSFNRPIVEMMENMYPSFGEAEEALIKGNAEIMAFNKDFACTWDSIHKDMIVEYKGKKVGCMLDPKNFKLLDEYQHLTEALREAAA